MTTVSRAAVEQMVRAALLRHRPGGSMRGQGSARLIANISARHCHLDDGTLKILFGSDAKLTVMKPLHQAGAFASEEGLVADADHDVGDHGSGAAALIGDVFFRCFVFLVRGNVVGVGFLEDGVDLA